MKKIWKKIYKTDAFAHVVGTMMMGYLWLIYYSCRKHYIGYENLTDIWHDDEGIVICFWHSRLLMSPFAKRPPPSPPSLPPSPPRQAYVLTTPHRDGRYTAAMMRGLKGLPIYGSTSKRSNAALKQSVGYLQERALIIVTPDGPRGPACIAAPGCVQMSHLSNAWILPMAYSTSRKKIINSWDKLLLPLPFGHLYFHFGKAFKAQDFADIETARLHMQEQLNQITSDADNKK